MKTLRWVVEGEWVMFKKERETYLKEEKILKNLLSAYNELQGTKWKVVRKIMDATCTYFHYSSIERDGLVMCSGHADDCIVFIHHKITEILLVNRLHEEKFFKINPHIIK